MTLDEHLKLLIGGLVIRMAEVLTENDALKAAKANPPAAEKVMIESSRPPPDRAVSGG